MAARSEVGAPHAVIRRLPILALAVVACVVWLAVAETIRHPHPIVSHVRPHALVWGNYVFSSRAELDSWLHARGATFEAWATSHPSAAAVFGDAPLRPPVERSALGVRPTKPIATAGGGISLLLHRFVVGLLVAFALACLGLGIAPGSFRPRRGAMLVSLATTHRPAFLAAALCIIAGLAIGTGLS